jgi:DNA-binding IclR family transcriptional regulator
LIKHGWLKKNNENRYDLSLGLLNVCEKLFKNAECFKLMQKPLELLAEKTELSAKLSVRKGFSEYATALRAEASTPIAITGKIGASFPIVEGSVAGALLCESEKDELEKLLKLASDDLFERKEPELLYSRIADCKEKGYCFSGKKNRWNIEVLSVPVCFSSGDVFAAVSLLGFRDDFKGKEETLLSEVIKTKKECEKILKNSFSK